MLDIALIREKPDWVKDQLRKLNDVAAIERVDEILRLDSQRREMLQEVEALRNHRNKLSKGTGQLRGNKKLDIGIRFAQAKAVLAALQAEDYEAAVTAINDAPVADPAGDDAAFEAVMNDVFANMKTLGDRITEIENVLQTVETERENHLLWIPNLPHESVPVADSDEANVPHPVQGAMREFDFEPQAHWDLGPALGIIDLERGVKLGGTRFYILAGLGAQLQRAVINFLLDQLVHEHGFQEMYVPLMVKEAAMFGSGQFPKFMDTSYRVEEAETYMLPTAEVALANMFAGEILPADSLPLKFVAHTPCFRREKMSAGRDVRGIKRLHQFEKVEMFVITRPDDSYAMLETMTDIAAGLCAKLEIPYRRLEIVTGDLGFTATKKYDIEMWASGAAEWLEVSSCSNTEAFQARRAGIKYRHDDKSEFVHMLNGSALGIPRTLIAIMEHYQNADGTITVPTVLRPYLNGQTIIGTRG